ncbi:A/G-specific adenine glycosylase [Phormidium yuhuli AB48]|uniref:Adenine DNA glycosylase n=1 Tax=Phormidium yuhuli AB48 TaxID=2940671 RepID=A0ABY5AP22_9CYAN|nr:A/G-specific adenine glycosylase [Phormidium yuhuli]USR90592.1 A/G-specific adenine glycosylase [Phormidium yuhuli AB48]
MTSKQFSQAQRQRLRRSLLEWYGQQGRSLPWREEPTPYRIWISEVMLQQTQVKTVLPYFERWMQQFPDVQCLAQADLQTVLKAWEGLGYYARARNLHRSAQEICDRHHGKFPQTYDEVLALPGIGRSTAGAILSAAFGQAEPLLDGNVKRVLARLVALPVPPSKALAHLWDLSSQVLDPQNPRDFNQAIMDLGATCCTPKNPACLLCPWRDDCQAYQTHTQSDFPMTESRSPLPHKQIGVAVIWNDHQQILIDRRPEEGLLGGLWEFPGGKLEAGESYPDCIRREIQEELAIEVEVGEHLITVSHAYSHFKVSLHVYHCRHLSGEPQALESQEIRWVTLEELDEFPFPKANSKIIAALREAQGTKSP